MALVPKVPMVTVLVGTKLSPLPGPHWPFTGQGVQPPGTARLRAPSSSTPWGNSSQGIIHSLNLSRATLQMQQLWDLLLLPQPSMGLEFTSTLPPKGKRMVTTAVDEPVFPGTQTQSSCYQSQAVWREGLFATHTICCSSF